MSNGEGAESETSGSLAPALEAGSVGGAVQNEDGTGVKTSKRQTRTRAHARAGGQTDSPRSTLVADTATPPLSAKDVYVLETLQANQRNLEQYSEFLLGHITRSLANMPKKIRVLARIVHRGVHRRFPDAAAVSVGGMFFLRFVCPALVNPRSWLAEGQVSSQGSRNLLLMTKLVQNLANGALFGRKEEFMVPLNAFLLKHRPAMEQFCSELSAPEDPWLVAEPPQSNSALALAVQAAEEDFEYLLQIIRKCSENQKQTEKGKTSRSASSKRHTAWKSLKSGVPRIKLQDEWVCPADVPVCPTCTLVFRPCDRRYHCRHCGGVRCERCSTKRVFIPALGHESRVCDACYDALAELAAAHTFLHSSLIGLGLY